MTHDELLIHLMVLKPEETIETRAVKLNNAIRAVVELHKPFTFQNSPEETASVCSHCQLGVVGDVYPCETIYAIEKELQ